MNYINQKTKTMKTTIFILLKIGEICLIPIAYLLISFAGYLITDSIGEPLFKEFMLFHDWYFITNFYVGTALILILILIWLIYTLLKDLLPDWIESNKKLTEKIYKKLTK